MGADTNYFEILMSSLKNSIDGAKEAGDGAIETEGGLITIEPEIRELNKVSLSYMTNIVYNVESPLLDEPFYEFSSGAGGTAEEAIDMSVTSFIKGALSAWRSLVNGRFESTLENDFLGKTQKWSLTKSFGHTSRGIMADDDFEADRTLWSLIEPKIGEYLGAKSLYWIKLYGAKPLGGSVLSEVRINDDVCNGLSEIVGDYMSKLNYHGDFYGLKEYVFVKQEAGCFEPYPHSKEEVGLKVDAAVKAVEKCMEEKGDYWQIPMADVVGDPMLADEIMSWIPEMCAQDHWSDIKYSDDILLIRSENEPPTKLKKTCFTSYKWIEERLLFGFYTKRYPEKVYAYLARISAIADVVAQVEKSWKEKGQAQEFSKLRMNSVGCFVSPEYKVR